MRTSRRGGERRPVVTVIQPYVPAYRVPFFDELSRRLDQRGMDLEVVHGEPEGGQADRADARVGTWSVPIRIRTLQVRGHALHYRPILRRTLRSHLVIAELASTNLDTYLLALFRRRALMLWGHGKAYVTEASPVDSRLELWLARRAQRVFVYTEGGAAYLRSRGYGRDRLTVVRNSTDTVTLRRLAAAVTVAEVTAFRQQHSLGDGPVACFIGSYDDSKCLPLLFEAARLVHERLPDFRLLVAGAGQLQHLVDNAAADLSFVTRLPRAEAASLAVIGRVSSCVVVPGRVGLVAVDALALGLPVVTTTYPHHAPEAEYLTDDVRIVTDQTAAALALGLTDYLQDTERMSVTRRAAGELGQGLTVEAMAGAFADQLLPPA